MKTQTNKIILLLMFIVFSVGVNAQIEEVGKMLSGGKADAEKILQAYLKPYSNAFGADLNSSWYNTAKTHKLLGFDLTLSVSAAFVPKADKSFDASKLGLTATNVSAGVSPTIAGEKKTGQNISYSKTVNNTTYPLANYNTPQGTGWGIVPAPMLQLGLGLVKGTDVTVRYVPKTSAADYGSVDLFGIGVKHSLKQWIPGLKLTPFFNLSVFGGYTKMTTTGNISFQPSEYNAMLDPDPVDHTNGVSFDNQRMEMVFKGFTGNVIASFDLPVITFYAGAGFSKTTSNLKLIGNYPFPNLNGTQVEIINQPNPINIEMKSTDGSKTKPRLNAGFKLKMAIITWHVDYTYANYSVLSTGLGISIR